MLSLDFEVIKFAMPILLKGLMWTIGISICSILLGIVIGIVLCFAQMTKYVILDVLAKLYIIVFRGTPFLIQVFIIYYVLPAVGIYISALVAGILSLALYSASYMSEVFRAGIEAVDKGQSEAARALGMPYFKVLHRIVLPQSVSFILPPLTSILMSTVKNSSVLSIITIQELTLAGNIVIGITFSPVEVYLLVSLLYWILNIIIGYFSEKYEDNLLLQK